MIYEHMIDVICDALLIAIMLGMAALSCGLAVGIWKLVL